MCGFGLVFFYCYSSVLVSTLTGTYISTSIIFGISVVALIQHPDTMIKEQILFSRLKIKLKVSRNSSTAYKQHGPAIAREEILNL